MSARVRSRPVRPPSGSGRYLRIPVIHCVPSSQRRLRTAEIRTRSEWESEMQRVVLNAWLTKATAAEILANPATRRRQVTMTFSLNPLRSTRESAQTDVISQGQK
jgi:hypothetical protein